MAQKNRADAQRAALALLRSRQRLSPSECLRALREADDLTQTELGAEIGRTGPCVNGWEHGKDVPMRGVDQAKLEAWSSRVVAERDLPEGRILRPTLWFSAEERADVEALAKPSPEAA